MMSKDDLRDELGAPLWTRDVILALFPRLLNTVELGDVLRQSVDSLRKRVFKPLTDAQQTLYSSASDTLNFGTSDLGRLLGITAAAQSSGGSDKENSGKDNKQAAASSSFW